MQDYDYLARASDAIRQNREQLLQMEATVRGVKWRELRTWGEQYASEQSEYNPETDT